MRSSRSGADPLDPGPQGFAHRGLHRGSDFPENSLVAFALALEAGAGIECDLRLTADDQVVVFHDADARRICGSQMRIGASRFAELGRLRVGDGPIPTLESLLHLVAGRVPLLLEVKVDGDIWRWAPVLKRVLGEYSGPFGIMSFEARLPRLIKTNLPNVRRGLVEVTALGKPWVEDARRRMPVYSWTVRSPDQRRQAAVHADAAIWENDGRP
jgi:glycerophosphoryl diester phosphodiesterase